MATKSPGRKYVGWLCLVVALCTCTGCWDATEVDRLSIVTMSGVDIGPDGKSVRTTLQIALPSALGTTGGGAPTTSTGSQQAYVVESADGESAVDALETLKRRLSRKLFMGHRRALVIGESFARKDVAGLMDEVVRNPDSRLRAYIVIAYHTDAQTILKVPYPLNRVPADAIVELQEQGYLPSIDARRFIRRLDGYGDPSALGISLITGDQTGSKEIFTMNRIAVFRRSKLVGWLAGEAFDGYLLIDGRIRSINSSVHLDRGTVSSRCEDIRSKRSLVMVNGHPRIRIELRTVYDVVQNAAGIDFNNPQKVNQLQSALQQKLSKEMLKTMDSLQHQYRSDPFGFADLANEHHPRWWHRVEKNWRDVYAKLPVDTVVHVEVRNSGQINVPLRSDGGG